MGREKEAITEREDNWMMLARSKGHKCSMCSGTVIYDERDVFFATGMCGPCAGNDAKKD